MKNKFLIGTITVFVAIITNIVFLNFFNSSDNKDYDFQRKFSNEKLLKFDKKYLVLNKKNKYGMYYSTNNSIIEVFNNDSVENNNLSLNFLDYSFSKKSNRRIKFPVNSNVVFVDDKSIIYNSKSYLCKFDINTNNIIKINNENIEISFIISLENSVNKYLFFGEVNDKKHYKSGFFLLDFSENKIIDSKILQVNEKSYKPELIVKHSGYFQKANSHSIAFTCDKNPKIFIFNSSGVFENEFITKDNSPMPKVIKKLNNDYCYSREGLKFTNSGLFMDNNNLFVFSMTSKFKDKIIIDQYSKSTLKYVQSYKLNYNNYSSNDISNVFINGNKIILKFESNYASFTFSRYI